MARRFPRDPSLKRRTPSRDPKLLIVVVCEGELTEPDYLRRLARAYGNNLVEIIIEPGAGAPMTIVTRAIEIRKQNVRAARKSGNSFDEFFEVWAVFDIDEHPYIAESRHLADENGVKLAISNPCFEIWPLLHFGCVDRPMDRREAQRELSDRLSGYHHEKNPRIDFDAIAERTEEACNNAARCCDRREEEGAPEGNPSTRFYRLVVRVIENGRERQSRA